MQQGSKIWGAGSNAARRRCPAAPSDLPKAGGAAAPPAPPLAAPLLLGFIMSKKQERLRSELLSEDKITNLLGFFDIIKPRGWSIYRVKNPSPQIRILVKLHTIVTQ